MQDGAEMKDRSEANRLNDIMIGVSQIAATIFRNNVGVGWAGKAEKQTQVRMVQVHPGDVVVRNARPLRAGLCKGSADLIGWIPVLITQEMVGTTIAAFLSLEVKTETGVLTVEQRRFSDAVISDGGRAGVARNVYDAVQIALAKVTGKS
jgi:hypothetical protein